MSSQAEQIAKGIVLAATVFLREIEPNLSPHDSASWVQRIVAFERPGFLRGTVDLWMRERKKNALLDAVYRETLGMYRESMRNGRVYLRKDIERHVKGAVQKA